ncbi:hypothetical protein RB195_002959 [Necator americanus]|uniref:Uncharacterized protein n=1 Tax=Necator americanus TaxID=51031 RepID=A0ABR1DLG4_NECAM
METAIHHKRNSDKRLSIWTETSRNFLVQLASRILDEKPSRHQVYHGYLCSVQIRLPLLQIITTPINLVSRFETISDATTTTKIAAANNLGDRKTRLPSDHKVTIFEARQQQLNMSHIISVMTTFVPSSLPITVVLTITKRILYANPCVTNGVAVTKYPKEDQ